MHEIFQNPLWWVIPVLILASFLSNHKVIPDVKKPDSTTKSEKTEGSTTAAQPKVAESQKTAAQSAPDSDSNSEHS